MGFNGARVLALESRRAEEMTTLIRMQGGEPFVVPSMREVELDQHDEAFEFGRRLIAGEFDGVILLTGVGTRLLWKTLLTRFSEEELRAALSRTTIIVRGQKPSAAVREIGLIPQVQIPEPNTWREIVETMWPRPEQRLALQEYGKSNLQLVDGLRKQRRKVYTVRIYGWALPEDTAPLLEAAEKVSRREFEIVLLTASMQLVNLVKVAHDAGIEGQLLEALKAVRIGSIGPTTTETIELYGLRAAFEPSHPKMGLLVNEMASR